MKHISLLMSSTSEETLDTFAQKIFKLLIIENYEERFSSHYVDDHYFLGTNADVKFHVMLSDDEDYSDLPFWLELSIVNLESELNEEDVNNLVHNKLLTSGFNVARIDNFGQIGEIRKDYQLAK